MGDSWIVDNLNAALNTWNGKLAEIWQLLTESPQTFRGGQVWSVMVGIHGALQAIGYGLLVLFFAIGVVKTCGSFVEVKRPEHALKLFIRFALAKAAVTYGLELMQAVFSIVQGTVSTVITQSGTSGIPTCTAISRPRSSRPCRKSCGRALAAPSALKPILAPLPFWTRVLHPEGGTTGLHWTLCPR